MVEVGWFSVAVGTVLAGLRRPSMLRQSSSASCESMEEAVSIEAGEAF
jgi:hypothetical protein